jgi:FKBP-type peptidyl-prolyl cis-trans isomerase 2
MIENGTIVNVNYVGMLTDGTVFDSSEGNGLLRFEIGSGQIISGFENALIGKKVGDKVVANIEPSQAYGEVLEDLFVKIPKDRMPENVEVGQELQATSEAGVNIVVVKEVNEDHVLVDANHPLAGKDLVFEIEIVSIG